jgi:hypothetical protein
MFTKMHKCQMNGREVLLPQYIKGIQKEIGILYRN